jgi:hypothetical protein
MVRSELKIDLLGFGVLRFAQQKGGEGAGVPGGCSSPAGVGAAELGGGLLLLRKRRHGGTQPACRGEGRGGGHARRTGARAAGGLGRGGLRRGGRGRLPARRAGGGELGAAHVAGVCVRGREKRI